VIAPDADVKLWVDADVTQRGVRRWKELIGHGEQVTLESVIEQLKIRDARDQGRADAPAAMAADAILIDTTDLGDIVEVYLDRIENALGDAVVSREKARREEAWTRWKSLRRKSRQRRDRRPREGRLHGRPRRRQRLPCRQRKSISVRCATSAR
jgi:predicted kinase